MGLLKEINAHTSTLEALLLGATQEKGAYSVRPPSNIKAAFDHLLEVRNQGISQSITGLIRQELHKEIGGDPHDSLYQARKIPERITQVMLAHQVPWINMPQALKVFGFESVGDVVNQGRSLERIGSDLIRHVCLAYSLNKNWLVNAVGPFGPSPIAVEGIEEVLPELLLRMLEGRRLQLGLCWASSNPEGFRVHLVLRWVNLTLVHHGDEIFEHRVFGPFLVDPGEESLHSSLLVLQQVLALWEALGQSKRKNPFLPLWSCEVPEDTLLAFEAGTAHVTDVLDARSLKSDVLGTFLQNTPERVLATRWVKDTCQGLLDQWQDLQHFGEQAWEVFTQLFDQDPALGISPHRGLHHLTLLQHEEKWWCLLVDRWNTRPWTQGPHVYRAVDLAGQGALLEVTGLTVKGVQCTVSEPRDLQGFADTTGTWILQGKRWQPLSGRSRNRGI